MQNSCHHLRPSPSGSASWGKIDLTQPKTCPEMMDLMLCLRGLTSALSPGSGRARLPRTPRGSLQSEREINQSPGMYIQSAIRWTSPARASRSTAGSWCRPVVGSCGVSGSSSSGVGAGPFARAAASAGGTPALQNLSFSIHNSSFSIHNS